MNNELHVVIGANGNAGNAILERLVELGKNTVSVTRNGKLRNNKLNANNLICVFQVGCFVFCEFHLSEVYSFVRGSDAERDLETLY